MTDTIAPRVLTLDIPAGEGLPDMLPPRPGDFILTRSERLANKLIRFGQGVRIHGEDRKYCEWDHSALVLNAGGEIVEAVTSGVRLAHLDDYKDRRYALVRIAASEDDRRQAAYFAWKQIGARYDFLTILAVALAALTGCKLGLNIQGQFICSGLVARALERTGAIFDKDPAFISPADLAFYYKVEP